MAELFNSLPAAHVLRTFVRYIIAFCSQREAASEFSKVVQLIVADESVKCRDPHSNRSRQIPPEVVRGFVFDVFHVNFRSEVDTDVEYIRYGCPCKIW